MQPAGGGTPGPRSCDGLPRSVRQLDPAALLMLLVDADRPEPVRSGARELALFLTPEPGAEAKEVEETIEGMLLRLEEFCSLTDMSPLAGWRCAWKMAFEALKTRSPLRNLL